MLWNSLFLNTFEYFKYFECFELWILCFRILYLRWEKTKISIFLKYSKYFHKFLWNGRALPKPLRKIWRALGFGHLKLVSVCMVFLTIFQWQMFVISNDWSGAAVRARWIPQRPPARRNQMSPSFRFSCGPSWKCIGQAEAGLRGPHSIAGLWRPRALHRLPGPDAQFQTKWKMITFEWPRPLRPAHGPCTPSPNPTHH